MVICGLKLTHDGSIALIDNGKLIFSIEMEKIKNNKRFTSIEDTSIIAEILREYGYSPSEITHYSIDGWGGSDQDSLAIQPRLEIGENTNLLSALNQGDPYKLDIARYEEKTLKHNVMESWKHDGLQMGNKTYSYNSSLHVAGHIASAYCTSPFAVNGESSYVLIWDGGMYPRMYFFDADTRIIENLGPIFILIGNIYTIFSQHFEPFKEKGCFAKDSLSVAGKVMAYIALGNERKELFEIFDKIYLENYNTPMGFANIFANEFKKAIKGSDYMDEDILCTFHAYMEEMLVEKLDKKIKRYPRKSKNLCIAGGCALNIKWNSAIRNSNVFDSVYVPPFPNDSGSAIGTACVAMMNHTGNIKLDWNVYSGPEIIKNVVSEGWLSGPCSLSKLAKLIYESDEPVVFLNGRAELGPRALGNRSIIANPTSQSMKDILNDIKIRENYRPVSPICIEQKAKDIFEPGIKDPFMLFDHIVKKEWLERIPAVCHLDNSARLQTINKNENPVMAELLREYEKVSRIPLLCNTSANYKGCGFFPDIYSATKWGKVNYVWCDNTLYEKKEKLKFD